ncbi:hypothetical protein [Halorhodospira halophila]|uniref:Uncharacterized protein n=1 Tax=Halorhodospira halophila (strain DSM 244 / SL1) TaxID=349124 RepID=A1WZJ3_HALHL|nr:hypothetical protein [Halorhodospira halophila]ABM63105.1 hypothetical protein Hhal_2342 [Halorhodospira halophila SL1]
MMTTQKAARRILGTSAELWVNPQRISQHRGSKHPYTAVIRARYNTKLRRPITWLSRKWHPFFLKHSWLPEGTPIEAEPKYRRIADLIEKKSNYRESEWYVKLREEVRTRGSARYKFRRMRTEACVDAFFQEHVLPLIMTMERDGYQANPRDEHGTVLVGEDGCLYKTGGGSHRFYVARLVGVNRLPVAVIGVHEEWARAHGIACERSGLQQLPPLLRNLEQRYA